MCHFDFCNIFGFCWPILTILSPVESEMITHILNKNLPLHLYCIATLPDKCSKYQHFLMYFSKKKYWVFQQAGHTEQVVYGYYERVHMMCSKWLHALHKNIYLTPFTPLVNSCIENVVVRFAPELNQPPCQFISVKDICTVNTFLNGHSYLIVYWVEVWAVSRSQIIQNKVWYISTQQFVSFTSTKCRRTVLLNYPKYV